MKRKIVVSLFTIIVAAAVIAGGTMAWFTGSADSEAAVFTAGTVSIEAGRKIDIDGGGSGIRFGTFLPDRVVEAHQGKDIDGNEVLPERSDPEVVLNNSDDFFSLGFEGMLVLEFEHGIYEPEIVIVTEVTGGNYPEERAKIYVSTTGEEGSWDEVDIATNQTGSGKYKISTLDVSGVPYVKYIKVEDITNRELYEESIPGNPPDGFDLNKIEISGYYAEEDNWNPGDCNERVYTIVNTGSKDINLRGELSGSWYEWVEDEWVSWSPAPDKGVVTIELADSEWTKGTDGLFYYKYSINGTYPDNDPASVTLTVNVCLDGEDTDNQYQGKRYILSGTFEAIQASNGASQASGWAYNPGETQD